MVFGPKGSWFESINSQDVYAHEASTPTQLTNTDTATQRERERDTQTDTHTQTQTSNISVSHNVFMWIVCHSTFFSNTPELESVVDPVKRIK